MPAYSNSSRMDTDSSFQDPAVTILFHLVLIVLHFSHPQILICSFLPSHSALSATFLQVIFPWSEIFLDKVYSSIQHLVDRICMFVDRDVSVGRTSRLQNISNIRTSLFKGHLSFFARLSATFELALNGLCPNRVTFFSAAIFVLRPKLSQKFSDWATTRLASFQHHHHQLLRKPHLGGMIPKFFSTHRRIPAAVGVSPTQTPRCLSISCPQCPPAWEKARGGLQARRACCCRPTAIAAEYSPQAPLPDQPAFLTSLQLDIPTSCAVQPFCPPKSIRRTQTPPHLSQYLESAKIQPQE
ncbi:hypothetical protein IWX48DRAFT_102095 [Phyllosticta citricarpa]